MDEARLFTTGNNISFGDPAKTGRLRRSLPAVLLILAVAWYLFRLDAKDFWVDEIWTIEYASRSPGEILACPDPVHPPLYYLLIHYWMALGQGEFVLRLFSVIFFALSLVLLRRFVARLFDDRTALVSGGLFALAPAIYLYAREARSYSLVLFLAILAMDMLYRCFGEDGKRTWRALYVVAMALMLLTHYATVVLIPVHVVAIAVARRSRARWDLLLPLIAPLALAATAFLFWGGLWRGIVGNIDRSMVAQPYEVPLQWLGEIAYVGYVFALGETVLPWRYPVVAAAALAFGGLLTAGLRELYRRHRDRFWILGCWFLFPVLIMCLVTDRAAPRYLIFCIVPFFIVCAVGYGALRSLLARAAISTLAVVPCALALANDHSGADFHNLARVDPARAAAEFLTLAGTPGKNLLLYPHEHKPLLHYLGSGWDKRRIIGDYAGEEAAGVERTLRRVKEAAREYDLIAFVRTSPGNIRDGRRVGERDRLVEAALERDGEIEVLNIFRRGVDPDRGEKMRWIGKHFMDYRISIVLFRLKE